MNIGHLRKIGHPPFVKNRVFSLLEPVYVNGRKCVVVGTGPTITVMPLSSAEKIPGQKSGGYQMDLESTDGRIQKISE